jgi:hypothetical protein
VKDALGPWRITTRTSTSFARPSHTSIGSPHSRLRMHAAARSATALLLRSRVNVAHRALDPWRTEPPAPDPRRGRGGESARRPDMAEEDAPPPPKWARTWLGLGARGEMGKKGRLWYHLLAQNYFLNQPRTIVGIHIVAYSCRGI